MGKIGRQRSGSVRVNVDGKSLAFFLEVSPSGDVLRLMSFDPVAHSVDLSLIELALGDGDLTTVTNGNLRLPNVYLPVNIRGKENKSC